MTNKSQIVWSNCLAIELLRHMVLPSWIWCSIWLNITLLLIYCVMHFSKILTVIFPLFLKWMAILILFVIFIKALFGWEERNWKEGSWGERIEWKEIEWIYIFYRYVWMKGKWEGRKMIFSYLFVWKSERKKRVNAVKWQFYSYIINKYNIK